MALSSFATPVEGKLPNDAKHATKAKQETVKPPLCCVTVVLPPKAVSYYCEANKTIY